MGRWLLGIILFVLVVPANASLIVRTSGFSTGYGGGASSILTSALDTATDVDTTESLDSLPSLLAYTSLWIDVSETDENPGKLALSTSELSSIELFISTGRRVVFIGENNLLWGDWNTQFLSLVGGSPTGLTASYTGSKAADNEITDGASTIQVFGAGFSFGGTPLYNQVNGGQSVVSLWGQRDNVLTVLDSFMASNQDLALADNGVFMQNVVDWIAAPRPAQVPEPSTFGLLVMGLLGVVLARKKSKSIPYA